MKKNRGMLAAVVVTVILSWIMIAVIGWNYEMNKRAEARRDAALSTSTTTPAP